MKDPDNPFFGKRRKEQTSFYSTYDLIKYPYSTRRKIWTINYRKDSKIRKEDPIF